jgi:hypothetical protein
MKHCTLIPELAALGLILAASAALAQEIEPGVQTSSAAAPVKPAAPPANAAAPAKPVPAAKTKTAANAAPNAAAGNARSSDRIELGTTQISGNRELPKVMYVVPWRRADPGDFAGRPPNSLLDEALTPVDRDVFRRQNSYYGAVTAQPQAGKPQAGAAESTATPKDEK